MEYIRHRIYEFRMLCEPSLFIQCTHSGSPFLRKHVFLAFFVSVVCISVCLSNMMRNLDDYRLRSPRNVGNTSICLWGRGVFTRLQHQDLFCPLGRVAPSSVKRKNMLPSLLFTASCVLVKRWRYRSALPAGTLFECPSSNWLCSPEREPAKAGFH